MNPAFLRRRDKILFYLEILQKMLLYVFLFYFQISNKSDEACLLTYSTSSHFLTQKGRVFSKKSRSPNFSSQLTARRQRCELLWIEFFFRYEKISSKLSQHFSTVWFLNAAATVAISDQMTPTVKSYVRCWICEGRLILYSFNLMSAIVETHWASTNVAWRFCWSGN